MNVSLVVWLGGWVVLVVVCCWEMLSVLLVLLKVGLVRCKLRFVVVQGSEASSCSMGSQEVRPGSSASRSWLLLFFGRRFAGRRPTVSGSPLLIVMRCCRCRGSIQSLHGFFWICGMALLLVLMFRRPWLRVYEQVWRFVWRLNLIGGRHLGVFGYFRLSLGGFDTFCWFLGQMPAAWSTLTLLATLSAAFGAKFFILWDLAK